MLTDTQLTTEQIEDVMVVRISDAAELNAGPEDRPGQPLYDLVDEAHCGKIILELSEVRVLSSMALNVLLKLREKTERIGGQIVLCGVRASLQKLLAFTRLDELFEQFAVADEALVSLGVGDEQF